MNNARLWKICTSTNNKGGAGKSSTIINLATYLSQVKWLKVLVVDCDVQCNLSQYMMTKEIFDQKTMNGELGNAWELFDRKSTKDVHELILPVKDNLDIIPGRLDDVFLLENEIENIHDGVSELDNIVSSIEESWLSDSSLLDLQKITETLKHSIGSKDEWLKVLKKKLSYIRFEYDYIFIDLPPSLSRIPKNAWVASNYLLIPISDKFALNGTEGLIRKMVDIKINYNEDLKFIFFFNKVPTYSNKYTKDGIQSYYKNMISDFVTAIQKNQYLSSVSYVLWESIRDTKEIEKSIHWEYSVFDVKGSKVAEEYALLWDKIIEITNK